MIVEEREIRVRKCRLGNSETPASNPPKTHFDLYVSAFRKFVFITGISCLSESDLGISHLEAKDWENFYQLPRKQAGGIPASILETWETYVSDSSRGIAARLLARPSRMAVESVLRWGDLLNTSPAATVLMKEALIGFAEKP